MTLDDVRAALVRAGQDLHPEAADAIRSVGPNVVPVLVEILSEELLLSADGPGEGWAPIHAVDLLTDLRAVEAIEPMLRLLEDTDFMDIVHDRLLQRMSHFGEPVVQPALPAYAGTRDEDFRISLAGVLSRSGVRDERIFTLLLERLTADTSEAQHLVDYGDSRALLVL